MSNFIFPQLSGLGWDIKKIPTWMTKVQRSASGKEARAAMYSYPLWNFEVSCSVMNHNTTKDFINLLSLYNQCQGAYDSFLYDDPTDDAMGASLGGDGVTTIFTVPNANGTLLVYVNQVLTTTWIWSGPNQITFNAPPSAGSSLTFAQQLGIGDGMTTDFQLIRTQGAFIEPIQAINGTPAIYDNGSIVSTSSYTLGNTGVITFNAAPAQGDIISAVFNYYYRCRFTEDQLIFNQIFQNIFEVKAIKFISIKL